MGTGAGAGVGTGVGGQVRCGLYGLEPMVVERVWVLVLCFGLAIEGGLVIWLVVSLV